MNLRSLVRGAIGQVNPDQQILWLKYLNYSIDSKGAATPTYAAAQPVWSQVQPLSTERLAHMDQLGIQGVLRSVRINGAIASAVREDGTGGDRLKFPEIPAGSMRTWLVMIVNEQWNGVDGPAWCSVTVQLQNG